MIRPISFLLLVAAARAATSLSQYGITWTFNADYTTGQYANGDYYVVAPSGLTITGISPASVVVATRPAEGGGTVSNSVINGSMVNPTGGITIDQGFDGSLNGGSTFNATLNAARPGGSNLSGGNPLVLAAGSSLVSAISATDANARPALTDAAVLTVVTAAPAANSFRPPYCGTDKTHHWNVSDLDYSKLPDLAAVTGTPVLATVAAYFTRPWIEICTDGNQGRYYHPSNNQPDYGADMADRLYQGELSLVLNYSDAQKETLLIRLVQYGLDIYGCAVTGGNWFPSGGLNQGRKMPLVLAAVILDDANIAEYADAAQHLIFQEDGGVFLSDLAEESVITKNGTAAGDYRPRQNYVTKTSAVTFTAGSPGVVNWAAHLLGPQQGVTFTTTGTLPAELTAGVTYWTTEQTISATATYTGMFATIATTGTTDFTAIGASFNFANTYFVATGIGTGSGTVTALPQNTFRLATQSGAAAMAISGAGTGTHTATFTMIDVPEWGERHSYDLTWDGSNWNSYYRNVNYSPTLGAALAARLITGAKAAWNNQVFFDYYDRVYTVAQEAEFPAFSFNMWAAYRDQDEPTLPGRPGTQSLLLGLQ